MAPPRLHVDAPLRAGLAAPLREEQVRYLASVLRLETGAPVTVFNTTDGEWSARFELLGRKAGAVTPLEQTAAPAQAADLMLVFSPVKRHGTDLIAEKATELGARTLTPALCRRTVAETVRVDRLAAIAVEAAEQCGRIDVPDIREARPLARVLESWDGRPLLFADEAGDAATIPAVFARADMKAADRMALLTGPEGGFDPDERRMLRALPYVTPVSLGARILRAETAAIAGLALILAHWRS